MIFGVVFILLGILGFFTGQDKMLLGIFHVNAVLSILYLLCGAFAFFAAKSGLEATETYFRVFGIGYAIVAILGFVFGDTDILGFISSNMATTWLHVVIALVALYAGFMLPANDAASRTKMED